MCRLKLKYIIIQNIIAKTIPSFKDYLYDSIQPKYYTLFNRLLAHAISISWSDVCYTVCKKGFIQCLEDNIRVLIYNINRALQVMVARD